MFMLKAASFNTYLPTNNNHKNCCLTTFAFQFRNNLLRKENSNHLLQE